MTNKELTKLLLYHNIAGWIVLHLQCLVIDKKDPEAMRVWKNIFQRRLNILEVPRELMDCRFMILESEVAHLIPTVSFFRRYDNEDLVKAGFSDDVANTYELIFYESDRRVSGDAGKLILILRNALSHFSDYLARDVAQEKVAFDRLNETLNLQFDNAGEEAQENVAFDKGLVRFWTKTRDQEARIRHPDAKAEGQEVVFNTRKGWLKFLKDCHKALFHLVSELSKD